MPSKSDTPETFADARNSLSREQCYMATVYAMNTLLIGKGMYTQAEFDVLFIRWAKTHQGEKP